MENDFHSDHVVLAPANATKSKNAFAIVIIVLGIISIVFYAICIAILAVMMNTDYMNNLSSGEALGAIIIYLFQAVFVMGGGVAALIGGAIFLVIQFVMFILGFTVKRLPRKPMIPAGIIYFLSIVGYIIILVFIFYIYANLGINIR